MGFWHTGYQEFHEDVGLGAWEPEPVRYRCPHCDAEFGSEGELRQHRFEKHPVRRPMLFLGGRELGTQRIRVAQAIRAESVAIEHASRALINGRSLAPVQLGAALASVSDDVCVVTLSDIGVEARYELDIRVAAIGDLDGVEREFNVFVDNGRFSAHAVEEFANRVSRYHSAAGYGDGICAYLYGVMAKERAPDCSLGPAEYVTKYNYASQQLAPYDRRLAHTIRALVSFHFNHFSDAAALCPDSRLGGSAGRFARWLDKPGSGAARADAGAWSGFAGSSRETATTELDTERILAWSNLSLSDVATQTSDVEAFIERDATSGLDRLKLHVLLGEAYAANGDKTQAVKHAKELRNVPGVSIWADRVVGVLGANQ